MYMDFKKYFKLFQFWFIVISLLKKMKHQAREQIEERRPSLVSALKQVGDFYMQIKWDFQSWGKY